MDIDFALRPGEGLPLDLYRRLRAAGPVVWSDSLGGWAVSGYEAARSALADVSRFTSAGTPVAEVFGTQGMLVNDTPLHHALRAVWARHVGIAAMEQRTAELEANAAGALAAVQARLAAGETVDFIPVFRDFVIRFIVGSFGVPAEHAGIFFRWSELSADTPALGVEQESDEAQRHFTVRQEVFDLIDELVADRQRRFAAGEIPGDLTALMVAAEGREGITAPVVRDNLFNFMLGALDTTEKWLGNVVLKLCGEAEWANALRKDRASIAAFNEEVMRHTTVVQTIQRRVRLDGAELGGRVLHEGDPVFFLLGAANRDPAAFADPDRFDPAGRGNASHLGFGFGFHQCLGINIARQEVRAFVRVLPDALPGLRVAASDFGESWALWGPRRLELAL